VKDWGTAGVILLVAGLMLAAAWGEGKTTLIVNKPKPPPPKPKPERGAPRGPLEVLPKPGPWAPLAPLGPPGSPVISVGPVQYAAIVQLTGPEAFAASAGDVADKLRSLHRWEALDVFSDAKDLPKGHPFPPPVNTMGRFWVIGIPLAEPPDAFAWPRELQHVWTRQVFK
jgi:hypothetical protein